MHGRLNPLTFPLDYGIGVPSICLYDPYVYCNVYWSMYSNVYYSICMVYGKEVMVPGGTWETSNHTPSRPLDNDQHLLLL